MRCLLFGHSWSPSMRGAGQFINRNYMVCNQCGTTTDIGPADTLVAVPSIPNAFERLESANATRAKAMRSPIGAADTTPVARRSLSR